MVDWKAAKNWAPPACFSPLSLSLSTLIHCQQKFVWPRRTTHWLRSKTNFVLCCVIATTTTETETEIAVTAVSNLTAFRHFSFELRSICGLLVVSTSALIAKTKNSAILKIKFFFVFPRVTSATRTLKRRTNNTHCSLPRWSTKI